MTTQTVPLDNFARQIAAEAGIAWRELPDLPGFTKGRWRDDARWLINHVITCATIVEGRRQWNGKIGEEMVANLTAEDICRVMEQGNPRLGRRPR